MATITKKIFITLFTCISILNVAQTQQLIDINKSVEIPFEYINNFIILNVKINEKLPLKFIFDTGAEYTILTKRELVGVSGIKLYREFKILGADLKSEITAYLGRNVSIQISQLFAPSSDILVFKEDYFKFEELTGVEVHGIIGANIFSQFILSINYKKKVITLYNPANFSPPKGKYISIPLEIIKNKPYLNIQTIINSNDEAIDVKLLLDTGASLSLLLYTDTHESITFPPTVIRGNIGMGLGGDLEGYVGRIYELTILDYKLNNVVANFQEIHELLDTTFLNGRNGIIGNVILDRFNVIIDYKNDLLYLKPNKRFKEAFKFDKSGLTFIASGKELQTIVVSNVVPGSPADEVGVQKGDIIKSINWIPSGYLTLKDLTRILQKKEGKRIKIKLNRDGKTMKFEFKLRELI